MAEYDSDAVRALSEELGKELYRLMPTGAAAIVFDFSQVGRGGGGHASGYSASGDRIPASPGISAFKIARQLRDAMYRPGAGTWFSTKITVTAQGSMDADFNYDDEPQWDEGIPAHWFVTDLERFPRDDSAIPEWLKEKVAQAAS